MNREILFRGFHEDENGKTTIYVDGRAVVGHWVEGGYAEIAPPPVCFSNDPKEPTTVCIVIEEGFADWGMPRRYGLCEVIPSTVGQYTGLNDKNGKKIFEGDIVFVNDYAVGSPYNDFIGTIIFSECAYFIDPADPKDSLRFYNECAEYEVTGTIFDKEATL